MLRVCLFCECGKGHSVYCKKFLLWLKILLVFVVCVRMAVINFIEAFVIVSLYL